MGFDCLSQDQDKIALDIARQLQTNFKHLSASTLPAVAGNLADGDPLTGSHIP